MLEKLMDIDRSERKLYFQRRLVSEMKFAMLLSQKNGGKYDALIKEAESYIAAACEKDGMITQEIMEKAEAMLMPLSEEAKTYELYCAAHAHIDMNWQWPWDETVKIVIDTTRSILKIMEEYPEFKFSQSQASVYKILEDYAPELLEKVKEKVHEKRWEVSASTWVEADKNMPDSESAVRQILYAKRYLSGLLDIPADSLDLDFEPDTFGHHVNVPEILHQANIKYYYHCRGMNDCEYQLYVWRAPSGAEILVNRERNFYLVDVKPDIAFHAFSTSELTGVKKTLHVYGVGDHGGGPTRRDVERLLDMNQWPIYPTFRLSGYHDFFHAVEPDREKLPVYTGEINCIFDGCFTSQSRNKNGNRCSERLLYKTEAFRALANMPQKPYPHQQMENSWRKVLLNQFHDIVTGSGVRATREYATGLYQEVKASSESILYDTYGAIADSINTELIVKEDEISKNEPDFARAYGAGVGSGQVERGSGNTRIFHIFNPTSRTRTETVEMLLWEWYGDPDRIEITDADGEKVAYQILEKGYNNYWYHNYTRLLIMPTVPAFGYTTVKLTEGALSELPIAFHWERRHQDREILLLENELLRVEFNPYDASIVSAVDKKTGKEYIDKQRKCGVFQYILEANHKAISEWRSEMSSWLVGRFKTIENLNENLEIRLEHGSLRSSLSFTVKFHASSLEAQIYLNAGSRNLNYKVRCDWHEIGTEEKGVPRLQFLMPVPYKEPLYLQDVPFGVIERGETGTDTPALSFAAAFGEERESGIAVSSKNTYGYRLQDSSIALALLRSSYDPDIYPENGICEEEFCVRFIEEKISNLDLLHTFREYNHGMDVVSGNRHGGTSAPKASYMGITAEHVFLSSVKAAEDSEELILRLYETSGSAQKAKIHFDREVHSACRTDLLEQKTDALEVHDMEVQSACRTDLPEQKTETLEIYGMDVEAELNAYEIMTIKVKL